MNIKETPILIFGHLVSGLILMFLDVKRLSPLACKEGFSPQGGAVYSQQHFLLFTVTSNFSPNYKSTDYFVGVQQLQLH